MLKVTKLICFLGLLMGLTVNAGTSFADTDYQCLHSCTQTGKSGPDCMTQCTYGASVENSTAVPSQPHKPPAAPENHNVLPDIVLTGDEDTILPPKKLAAPEEKKDYKCIQQCLTTHAQYQMCEKSCTTIPTPGSQVIMQKPSN